MTNRTRLFNQKIGERFFHLVCPRLLISPFCHRNDSFKSAVVFFSFPLHVRITERQQVSTSLLEFHFRFFRQIIITAIHGKLVTFKKGVKLSVKPGILVIRKRFNCPQTEGYLPIRDNPVKIRLQRGTKPHARRTGTERIIERKNPRHRLR